MSIQVKCNGCDRVIDTLTEPWFEAAFFDPKEDVNEEDESSTEDQLEAGVIQHLCSAECVSAWGARMAMEKWSGSVP